MGFVQAQIRKKPAGKERSKPRQTRDREKRCSVAFTPDERAEIQRRARRAGKPVSTYMRECALGAVPRSTVQLEVARDLLVLADRLDDTIKAVLIEAARRLQ